jgi:predicted GNAT family acetyltransferase
MRMEEETYVVRDAPERQRFEIDLRDGTFAIADYRLMPGRITFIHTKVPEGHEGEGLGTALIRAGLSAARKRGLKVIPICPFFAAYIREHPEEQDLLEEGWRSRLGLTKA